VWPLATLRRPVQDTSAVIQTLPEILGIVGVPEIRETCVPKPTWPVLFKINRTFRVLNPCQQVGVFIFDLFKTRVFQVRIQFFILEK
jgi:hypothetical protein